MNLPPRNLSLKRLVLKDRPVLALDTGFAADSLEGLRLVKASRGQGWFFDGGALRPWTTRGVLQENGRLVIWGDLDEVPEGRDPGAWPLAGDEGRSFLRSFVQAWTARAAASEPLGAFTPTALIPWMAGDLWTFVFPPPDLRAVLDTLQPHTERLPWEHFRHPEAAGTESWAFTSAALALHLASGTLPWAQDTEEHLRQELRDLKKTFSDDELPPGPDGEALKLWSDSLTGRAGPRPEARWKAWAEADRPWDAPVDPVRAQKQAEARARRERHRSGAAFWRKKGTLITVAGAVAALVLFVVGTVVWGAIEPHPTDTWTPEQVVRGYYAALSDLDSDLMQKITSFDKGKEKDLGRDQDEATNLYVIRQVRIAYEKTSPVLVAQDWEDAGRPALILGQMLWGVAGLEVQGAGTDWAVRYRKWVHEGDEETGLRAVGADITDRLTLVKTGRGWKISSLVRDRRPLP